MHFISKKIPGMIRIPHMRTQDPSTWHAGHPAQRPHRHPRYLSLPARPPLGEAADSLQSLAGSSEMVRASGKSKRGRVNKRRGSAFSLPVFPTVRNAESN